MQSRRFGNPKRFLRALNHLELIDLHLAQGAHSAHILKHVHHKAKSCCRKSFFFRGRIHEWLVYAWRKVESSTDGQVVNVDEMLPRDILGNNDLISLHGHFRKPCVLKSKYGCEEKDIDEVAIII